MQPPTYASTSRATINEGKFPVYLCTYQRFQTCITEPHIVGKASGVRDAYRLYKGFQPSNTTYKRRYLDQLYLITIVFRDGAFFLPDAMAKRFWQQNKRRHGTP